MAPIACLDGANRVCSQQMAALLRRKNRSTRGRDETMANLALYNRWRGQTFADILGQEHITQTLQNQIRAGRIGHAYLFTGLRGTGKTSTARILAKAVNCVGETDTPPCNTCPICRSISNGSSMDLIEIDAASNRGIDEIRDLRERVVFAPSEARYKVYVIDEVHMLTNEAFNALLKTLEEPPAHVIFVLCTTEPHRLPDTIISRCQRFDFRRAAVQVVVGKLRRICEQEEIKIEPQALEFVARKGAGSFRDAESLLDQLAAYDSETISLELVQRVLGTVDASSLATIVEGIVQGELAAGLRAIDAAMDRGADPRQFLGDILDSLRAVMLLRVGGDEEMLHLGPESLAAMRRIAEMEGVSLGRVVQAIKRFNQAGQTMRYSARPQIPFELAFVESALDEAVTATPTPSNAPPPPPEKAAAPTTAAATSQRAARPERKSVAKKRSVAPATSSEKKADRPVEAAPEPAAPIVQPAEAHEEPSEATEQPSSEQDSQPKTLTLDWVRGNWSVLLLKLKMQERLQARALLNSSYPLTVSGDQITLVCEGTFHTKSLMEGERRQAIESLYSEILGAPIRITCVADSGKVHQLLRVAQATPEPKDLFASAGSEGATPAPTEVDGKEALLQHPAVQELRKRGGVVSRVVLDKDQKTGENDG